MEAKQLWVDLGQHCFARSRGAVVNESVGKLFLFVNDKRVEGRSQFLMDFGIANLLLCDLERLVERAFADPGHFLELLLPVDRIDQVPEHFVRGALPQAALVGLSEVCEPDSVDELHKV